MEPNDFDPAKMAMENEERQAQISGYHSSAFTWFGNDIPPELVGKCLMCDSCLRIPFQNVIEKGIPTNCPTCNRKSLRIFDVEKWEAYKNLKLWEFDFFLDQYKESYAAHQNGNGTQVMLTDSMALDRIFVLRLKNPHQLVAAKKYADGLAARSGKVVQMENRVAMEDDKIWIDACSKLGEAVEVSKDGWKVVDKPPVMFRRFDHQLPFIVEQGFKEDFDEYMNLMNFSTEEDRILYSGYAPTLFHPNISHPIFIPIGPAGAAKTTTCLLTRMICDPSSVPLLTIPKDEKDLPLTFYSNYCPIFENVSYLTQELSDTLCRAVTGGGISTRRLYTNKDLMSFSFRLPTIINATQVPTSATDFNDRSLIVRLERIQDCQRREESEINRIRDRLLPKVRGYLLTTLADAMAMPSKTQGVLPRLADFGRLADSCLAQMGYEEGRYIAEYLKFSDEAQVEAVRSDVFADALLDLLEKEDGWEGSASDLKRKLEADYGGNSKSKAWPKDSTRISDAIFGRIKPALMKMGWYVLKSKSNSKRTIVIHKQQDMKNSSF